MTRRWSGPRRWYTISADRRRPCADAGCSTAWPYATTTPLNLVRPLRLNRLRRAAARGRSVSSGPAGRGREGESPRPVSLVAADESCAGRRRRDDVLPGPWGSDLEVSRQPANRARGGVL